MVRIILIGWVGGGGGVEGWKGNLRYTIISAQWSFICTSLNLLWASLTQSPTLCNLYCTSTTTLEHVSSVHLHLGKCPHSLPSQYIIQSVLCYVWCRMAFYSLFIDWEWNILLCTLHPLILFTLCHSTHTWQRHPLFIVLLLLHLSCLKYIPVF